MADTTTIQISTLNRDGLLRLGQIMQERNPEVFDRTPTFNATIGYALTHLTDDFDVSELLPTRGTVK